MTTSDKAIRLFEYLGNFSTNTRKIITDYAKYENTIELDTIPRYEDYVKTYDELNGDSSEQVFYLAVKKPELSRCPEPQKSIKDWIKGNYSNAAETVSHIETREVREMLQKKEINFNDDLQRVNDFDQWEESRKAWIEAYKKQKSVLALFGELYSLYRDIKDNPETKELIVANGLFCVKNNAQTTQKINHPILTKRISIHLDSSNATIYLVDLDSDNQIVADMFQSISDVDIEAVKALSLALDQIDCNPMESEIINPLFTRFMNQLSVKAKFVGTEEEIQENISDIYFMRNKPLIIYRKRNDGAQKAIEKIIENIEETGFVPASISDIVSGETTERITDSENLTIEIEEQLANVGGESSEILLSKEANSEQLEIAKRIEKLNGVIVQGPPGTGKTHTIANLLGHFLAQGKSVLVTSHTPKALNVLKDKLVLEMQDLCVALTDDNNKEMIKSVNGITNYMSQHTTFDLRRQVTDIEEKRNGIMSELADVRKKVFAVLYKENNQINIAGEEISPISAAKYVQQYSGDLDIIPGKVELFKALPLSINELSNLYDTNGKVNSSEEHDIENVVPDPTLFINPDNMDVISDIYQENKTNINSIIEKLDWLNGVDIEDNEVSLKLTNGEICNIDRAKCKNALVLFQYLNEFISELQPWMLDVIASGKRGGAYAERWNRLIEQIDKTAFLAEAHIDSLFGKTIDFADFTYSSAHVSSYKKIEELFRSKGKLSRFDTFKDKELEKCLSLVKINGLEPKTAEDLKLTIISIELNKERELCANYWKQLVEDNGGPSFIELSSTEPEAVASKQIKNFNKLLKWYKEDYSKIRKTLEMATISPAIIFGSTFMGSDIDEINIIVNSISGKLIPLLSIISAVAEINSKKSEVNRCIELLQKNIHIGLCSDMLLAVRQYDKEKYREYYGSLYELYQKRDTCTIRYELLRKMEAVAPGWAKAIENREGIHGESVIPENIESAWKWKQYSSILNELYGDSIEELQEKATQLSKSYRDTTAELAAKKAWLALISRVENDLSMTQALNGWAQTVQKIGKGTGKKAAQFKAQARELMKVCQKAVPAWIMPVSKALEMLDPRTNHFDIVIVDEASQSDISALAVTYLAEKVIIVGDDKQVSPLAVGIDADKIKNLMDVYIKDTIPMWHLYNEKASLYDIAALTFRPLMLREHFRCVPDIIGYSNKFYYDYKIKPLRDASSSKLLPAVVNYRVRDGVRSDGKTNDAEAKMIASLIVGCMEQPEYANKSFGAISLLGDEQAKLIQKYILEKVDLAEYEKRNIMCGNSATFQGDERDVVFLSMVDSCEDGKVLSMRGEGSDGTYSKRYNVATSRARDQLWVVHSLDASNHLKGGDIRRGLLEYAANPKAFAQQEEEIIKKSDSPFEIEVANALVKQGYHIVQQWEVGAYRIDMVAMYGNNKIAIECDGEAYHSSEEQVRRDMERQTILERIGWRFIRIRGSEFYRNKEATIQNVMQKLNELGIVPENTSLENIEKNTDLLMRVKSSAQEVYDSWDCLIDEDAVIEFASSVQRVGL